MRLQLALLGGIQVRLDAGRPIDLPSRSQALLAYLALQPGVAHPREKLATLLWADAPASRARHSLRQTLLSMRQLFARGDVPGLRDHGGTLTLEPDAIDVDAHTFERLVSEGTPESLGRAAAHYRGELLEGLTVQSPPFEEWLMVERERLRELALDVLARLLAHHERTGAVEAAVQSAIQLLGIDPGQEPVHRLLMRLYVRQDRRSAALRQYQLCAASLQRELGVEPEPVTKQLYQDILQGRLLPEEAPSHPAAPRPRAHATSRLGLSPDALVADVPLVGRRSELVTMEAAWRDARAGRGRVLAILGEGGAGKSRLLVELARAAWGSKGTVLVGHARESTQALPFGPWIEAFRAGHVIEHDDFRERIEPVWCAELARLFPELGAPPAAQGFENSVRLFEALTRLITDVANERPLLLALEDLHWTDGATVQFLAFLTRRIREWPVLLVLTAREEELGGSSLRRLLDELEHERSLVTVMATPLSREETAVLVRAVRRVGSEDPALVERVWSLSGGNPFTAVEVARAVGSGGVVVPDVAVPARVRAFIAERLDRLSAVSRELVAVAAVVGRPIEFMLLSRAADQDERTAAGAVEELVRRRVFVESQGRLDFAHERIRAVAEATLLEPTRRALHAAVARTLEEVHAGRLDGVADRLAFHHARSQRPEKAVPHLSRLAETAARAYAHAEAIAALQEAITLLTHAGGAESDRRIVELALREAFSLSILGRFREITELLVRERPRIERLDDPSLTGAYEFRLGMTCTYLGDLDQAIAHGQRAIEHASRCGDAVTLGKAHYMLSISGYYLGRFAEALDHARDAVRLLAATDEPHWLGMAYGMLANNHYNVGQFEAALGAAARLEAIGDAAEDPRLRSSAAWLAGLVHATRGETELGVACCRKSVELAADPINRVLASSRLGYAYLEAGDAVAAIAPLGQAVQQMDKLAFRQLRGLFLAFLAEAYLLNHEVERARETAEAALALAEEVSLRAAVGWAQRTLGRIARATGDAAQADAYLTGALSTFETIGAVFEAARTRLDLAETAAARDDRDAAADHLAAAHRTFTSLAVPPYIQRTEARAGRLNLQGAAS
jgi:DNA-binding SARP family transcriptional activator/tetratricopeptide (TPR) repeat protein